MPSSILGKSRFTRRRRRIDPAGVPHGHWLAVPEQGVRSGGPDEPGHDVFIGEAT
jgi:hypothetical protein